MWRRDFGYSILNICSKADRDGSNGYVARPIEGQVDTPEFGVAYTQASRRSTIVQAVLDISADLARQGIFDDLVLRPGGMRGRHGPNRCFHLKSSFSINRKHCFPGIGSRLAFWQGNETKTHATTGRQT